MRLESKAGKENSKINSLLRKLVIGFISLAIFLTLLLAILPFLASTDWSNKNILTPYINKRISGSLSMQKIHLSWLGDQKIEGLVLKDATGNAILTFDLLSTDTSLWNLLHTPPRLGKVELVNLDANLEHYGNGITNFHQSLNLKEAVSHKEKVTQDFVQLSNVNARLILPSANTPLLAYLEGETRHNDITGKFVINSTIQDLVTPALWKWPNGYPILFKSGASLNLKLNVEIVHFPVEVVDRVISLVKPEAGGLLTAALGRQLDFSLNQTATEKEILLKGTISAPHLNGEFHTLIDEGELRLAAPFKLDMQMTPEFVTRINPFLPEHLQLVANREAQASLIIDELHLPLEADTSHGASLQTKLQLDHAQFDAETALHQLELSLVIPGAGRWLHINFKSDVEHNGDLGQLLLVGKASPKWLVDFSMEPNAPLQFSLQMDGKQIPTLLMDTLTQQEGLLIDLIGKKSDFSLRIDGTESLPKMTLSLTSERVSFSDMQVAIEKEISLLAPLTIHYRLSPHLTDRFINQTQNPLQIADIPFTLQLNTLSFPIPSLGKGASTFGSPDKIHLEAELSASEIFLKNLPLVSEGFIKSLKWKLGGSSVAEMTSELTAYWEHGDSRSKSTKLLGDRLDISSTANLQLSSTWEMRIPTCALQVRNAVTNLELTGSFDGRKAPVLSMKGLGSYTLTKETVEKLGWNKPGHPHLHTPTSIHLLISQLKFPLNNDFLNYFRVAGKVEIDNLTIHSETDTVLASLEQVIMPVDLNSTENHATLSLSAKTSSTQSEKEGSLLVQASASNWVHDRQLNLRKAFAKIQGELHQFPVALIETLSGYGDITALIGPYLNLNLSLNREEKEVNALEISLVGDQFQANGSFKVEDNITLRDPARPVMIDWTLTPQRFAVLRKNVKDVHQQNDPLKLNAATSIVMKISDINFPLYNTGTVDSTRPKWMNSAGTIHISLDRISLSDQLLKQTTLLDALSAKVATHNISEALAFELGTKGQVVGESAEHAEIHFKGLIEHPFTATNELNPAGMSLTLDGKTVRAPIILLCNFFCLGDIVLKQLDALIGDRLDADIHLKIKEKEGPFKVALKGSYGSLNLQGQLQKGYLTLNQPLTAEVTVTPKLTNSFVEDLVPLLSSAVSADAPVKMSIQPDGFAFPLELENLSNIRVESAMIDLGKIYFVNKDNVAQILSLLNFQPSAQEQLNIWFTPLHFKMQDGVVRCERIDMLVVNRYHAALWGKVDFIKDKISMTLGLSGSTLTHAFGVKGIPEDTLLQLPLKGTTANASLDKSKATTKISALIAQSQGSPQAALVGGILDILGGKEHKPPPPTTYPFPWQNEPDETSETADNSSTSKSAKRLKLPKVTYPLPELIDSLEAGAKKFLR